MKHSRILLIFLIGISIFFGSLFWGSNLLIYPPSSGFIENIPDKDAVAFSCLNPLGQKIHAWWYPGKPNSGAIILCHGHGVNHRLTGDMMPFLRKAGFSLLLFDFRSHGLSDGSYTGIGLNEWEDIDAVIREAQNRSLLTASMSLAAFGRSMGAASLINGSGRLSRIHAFILESSFAELRSIAANDFIGMTSIPDNPFIDLSIWFSEKRTGINYRENKPMNHIHEIGSRPVMLIHDSLDSRATREQHDKLASRVPHARILIVPGAGHVQAHKIASATFEREILTFLASAGMLLE